MDDLTNDIEKYLQGKLTSHEMHLLEKRALDDPFLADALEGQSSINQDALQSDLKKLHIELAERTRQNSKQVILWWQLPARIAAGIIALAVTGYVIYNLLQERKNDSPLALNKPQAEIVLPLEKREQSTTEAETEPLTENSEPKTHSPQYESRSTIASKSKDEFESEVAEPNDLKSSVEELSAPSVPPPNEGTDAPLTDKKEEEQLSDRELHSPSPQPVERDISSTRSDAKQKKSTPAKEDRLPASTIEIAKESEKKPATVKGKVIDAEDGSPMPGVVVTVKGTTTRAVTKEDGGYKLSLPEDTQGSLAFSFVGMQNLEVPIAFTDSVNAKLSPDYASLNEVVVVGYTAPFDENYKGEKEYNYKSAEPVGGRREYKKYLTQSMRYPHEALDNKIQGRVTVQFTVETNGVLNDFKVLKGIGYGCDDEVIRLVKEGPQWTAPLRNDSPVKGKVKVRLKFILPK